MSTRKAVTKPSLLLSVVALFAFVVGFSACSDLNLDNSKGVGQMNFHLSNATDASKHGGDHNNGGPGGPPDRSLDGLEEVNIDIQELRVLFISSMVDTVDSAGVDSITVEPDEEDDGEWITIEDFEPIKVNLLDVTGTEMLLASAELEEGYYEEIRLILGDDNDVVVDGETHPLKVPSGQQSGYKLKLDEPLHSGEVVDLTIEFDAEESVKVTGNGQYMLKPVLHIYEGTADDDDEDV